MTEFATRARVKGTRVYVDALGRRATNDVTTVSDVPFLARGSSPYEGASLKPRLVKWNPPGMGPNAVNGASLATMRRRARERTRNDGLADGLIDTLVTNIVGTGIKPMFTTPDADFNQALADLWWDWCDEADADESLDFYGLQALAAREAFEAGEVFVRLRPRRPEDGLTVPLQVQVLESEFCDLNKNETSNTNGTVTIQGVQFSSGTRRRLGYWMFRDHPEDDRRIVGGRLGGDTNLVPANVISHMRPLRRSGAVRGVTWLAQCLVKLMELDLYDDAQLKRQQVAALFAGTVETDPQLADQFFAGQQVDADSPEAWKDLAPLTPGQVQVLNPGQKLVFTNPPSVGSDYEAYMRHQERRIATSGKVLYEQATGDYRGVNDRTWRAAMTDFRRRMEMIQQSMVVFQFCTPILLSWIDLGIIDGTIVPPRGIDVRQIKRCLWIADRWDYINPVQDIAAETAEVAGGLASRTEKVSMRGRDRVALDREIAAERQDEEDMGLVYTTNPGHKLPTAGADAQPTEPTDPTDPGQRGG
jgi:lambda family phage portal protein